LAAAASAYALAGEVIEDVQTAYEQACRLAQPDDLVWVGGSSFVVAELSAL
jgi:dihydrofolate synthase/folylpolyglutamate synthase